MYTMYNYTQDFTIECTIQQNAHEPELLLYWTDKNGVNISNDSQSSVWQRRSSDTAVELSIRGFNTSHNGNYTCHAQNSNTDNRKHITLIGERENPVHNALTHKKMQKLNLPLCHWQISFAFKGTSGRNVTKQPLQYARILPPVIIIGPPAKVGTPTVTVSGKIVHLIWEEPNGFGATISNYRLFYT